MEDIMKSWPLEFQHFPPTAEHLEQANSGVAIYLVMATGAN